MTKVTKPAVLIRGGLLASGTWAQADGAAKNAKTNQAPSESMPKSVAGPDYVIGADENLHISGWKETDLTTSLPVRPGGKISLAVLNDVPAARPTPIQLADSSTEKMKKDIADPPATIV